MRLGARHIERDAFGDDEAPGFATQVAAAIDAAGSRSPGGCLAGQPEPVWRLTMWCKHPELRSSPAAP
jgi:hypothetical protein